MTDDRIKIGIVGCGNISGAYLNAAKTFEILDIVACADLILERARAKAQEHDVPQACTVDELLANPEIRIVVNLTVPRAHYEVAKASLAAGKSTYSEKPLCIAREEGMDLLETAKTNGLRIGCAPDTFLGGGIQTCRKLIDDGAIGEPVAATAFFTTRGHERWHPDPEFFYQLGGGPMFDMGPYYLTALVNLLGPVRRVAGMTKKTFQERIITSQPKHGQRIRVDVPTHVAGLLEFVNGAIVTLLTSFDIWAAHLPYIEIYGTEGSLGAPNPNIFGGPVCICRAWTKDWQEAPLTHGYTENFRGLGVADMACAMRSGRPHRACGELANHVLDVMLALHEASRESRHIEIKSSCSRPAPLPVGLREGELDE